MDEQLAITTAFSLPAPDGRFDDATALQIRQLAARRPSVILAFAPKAAGTFLRAAATIAADGQLVRASHAQGERDAQFYLPTFLAYYLGKLTPHTLVAHVHMQALTANRHFIEAFDLKPSIMLRPIPDMLASYCDMLASDPAARHEGLNCRIPPNFATLSDAEKFDFLVDFLGPWYASYFATWFAYADECPGRVCLLDYDAFRADPAQTLRNALAHAGIDRSRETCAAAVNRIWAERGTMRFNRGISGRGRKYFGAERIARLGRMLTLAGIAPERRAMLLGA